MTTTATYPTRAQRIEQLEKQITETISANLGAEIDANKLCEHMLDILRKFEGKLITAHMRRAILTAHPEWCIHQEQGFLKYISVWAGDTGRKYDDRFTLYLRSGTYSEAATRDANICHLAAALARNERRKETLSSQTFIPDLARSIALFEDARSMLAEAFRFEGPFDADQYAIKKLYEEK